MKPLVAFDEAGNSGGNLLDVEQPVFVLASVSLTDEQAFSVLDAQDQEQKFSKLKRSSKGQEAILRILDSPILTEDRYVISGFHKRFMTITKMVDLLVEPLAHRDGVNLYERGANLALANMLYHCLPVFLGRRVFDMLIDRFVGMVRTPSHRTIQKFYQLLETAYRRHGDEDFAAGIAVLLASRVIAEDHADAWDGSELDPAIPAFVEHASVWTGRFGAPFRIVHDESKPIVNEQLVLEAMMSETDEHIEIGYDRRKMNFPIAAKEIELLDSAAYRQIQVADIVASGTAYCLRASISRSADAFSEALLKTRVLSGSFLPVWPELKVSPEDLGTTELGGVDSVDHIGEYVARRLGGIPAKGERRKR